MPRARIVFAEDGRGDTRDARILHAVLSQSKWDIEMGEPTGASLDAQFFISGAVPPGQTIAPATRNVAVVGRVEDLDASLPLTDIWALRTRGVEAFARAGVTVSALGYTSFDMRYDDAPKERSFFHCAGQSSRKKTQAIVRAWKAEWPQLIIVASPAPWWEGDPECAWTEDEERLSNIRALSGKLSDGHLRELMNRSVFHIYPMREDDVTRTLWEGLSCGSVVLALPKDMTEKDVEVAVAQAMRLPDEEIARQCHISRALWDENNEAFQKHAAEMLEGLLEVR